MDSSEKDILQAIYQVILERRGASTESSYTAALKAMGVDRILKKVGEEAAELIIAGKGGVRQEIICETADLFFHSLVLLGFHGIPPEEVYNELRRRFGMSGIEEKASRTKGTS